MLRINADTRISIADVKYAVENGLSFVRTVGVVGLSDGESVRFDGLGDYVELFIDDGLSERIEMYYADGLVKMTFENLMRYKRVSQYQMTKDTNLPQSTLSSWVSGKVDIRTTTVYRFRVVAEYLGLDMCQLFDSLL